MQQSILFSIVKCYMVHGPCGTTNPHAPCIKDGKCIKHYLKPFQSETVLNSDRYPFYAHLNDGRAYEVYNFMANNMSLTGYGVVDCSRVSRGLWLSR
jgi:hypothetical protein